MNTIQYMNIHQARQDNHEYSLGQKTNTRQSWIFIRSYNISSNLDLKLVCLICCQFVFGGGVGGVIFKTLIFKNLNLIGDIGRSKLKMKKYIWYFSLVSCKFLIFILLFRFWKHVSGIKRYCREISLLKFLYFVCVFTEMNTEIWHIYNVSYSYIYFLLVKVLKINLSAVTENFPRVIKFS